MLADDAAAGHMFEPPRTTASSELDTEDLRRSGYDVQVRSTPGVMSLEDYPDLLHGLNTTAKLKRFPSDKDGDNLDMTYTHVLETMQQGIVCPPTEASFCNVYNADAGLLVATNNFGPASTIALRNAEFRVNATRSIPRQRTLTRLVPHSQRYCA